jgi:hypothetical protein
VSANRARQSVSEPNRSEYQRDAGVGREIRRTRRRKREAEAVADQCPIEATFERRRERSQNRGRQQYVAADGEAELAGLPPEARSAY